MIFRTTFAGTIPYVEDPYERKREMEKKERKEHHEKMQEKAFSQRVKKCETFNKPKEVFGEDPPIPARKPPSPRAPLMEHDAPFKPSNPPKKGLNGTIDKFPAYIEDPMKQAVRKKEVDEDKARWKSTHKKKTVPQPSVVTNIRNLKTEFPSIFRKF